MQSQIKFKKVETVTQLLCCALHTYNNVILSYKINKLNMITYNMIWLTNTGSDNYNIIYKLR